LVYPEFSQAVKEFVHACATPDLREQLTSPSGLESIMRDGFADPAKLNPEVLAAVQEPFRTAPPAEILIVNGTMSSTLRHTTGHVSSLVPTGRSKPATFGL
jgi:hypothetical protein